MPGRSSSARRRRLTPRRAGFAVGLILIAAGGLAVALPLLGLWSRTQADNRALADWAAHGSALVGAAPAEPDHGSASPSPAAATCGSTASPRDEYALVRFASLPQGYAGVAGDGDWSLLERRSMVHYAGTAAPGQPGNSLIAFHREPSYEHIDRIRPGDIVEVQDRTCTVWHYRVDWTRVLDPAAVPPLLATDRSGSREITLITCDPFWIDTSRLLIRGTLADPRAGAGG